MIPQIISLIKLICFRSSCNHYIPWSHTLLRYSFKQLQCLVCRPHLAYRLIRTLYDARLACMLRQICQRSYSFHVFMILEASICILNIHLMHKKKIILSFTGIMSSNALLLMSLATKEVLEGDKSFTTQLSSRGSLQATFEELY